MATVVREAGRLDVLVGCAGTATIAPALDIDLAGWARTLDVNLTGTFVVARPSPAPGRARRRTHRDDRLPGRDGRAGGARRLRRLQGRLLGMTRTLALEWGPLGITVNTVSPTVVLTPLSRPNWQNAAGRPCARRSPSAGSPNPRRSRPPSCT